MNANGPHNNKNASEAHRWVVFVAGATASGKTTVAKYLASSLDAQFVEGDDVWKYLHATDS
jgi:gluconokinase